MILKTTTFVASIRRSIRASENNDYNDKSDIVSSDADVDADSSGEKIENLSTAKIIRKSTKSKRSDFSKVKKPDSTKKVSGADFLTPKVKIAFISL